MNNDCDLIVVGGGVFGSVIARTCKEQGLSVVVVDDQRPMSGSKPSGFLMKPSWMTFLPKKEMEDGFRLLDRLYNLDEVRLRFWPTKKFVYATHLDRNKVLEDPHLSYLKATVSKVADGVVHFTNNSALTCKYIVVAAGIWTGDLVPVPGLYGKNGMSFLFTGMVGRDTPGFIRPWAPYKQIVAHKSHLPDRYWVGDGSAIITKNWTKEVEDKIIHRVCSAVKQPITDAYIQRGIRPFVDKVKPCWYEKMGQHNIWVVTGGGKNGTIGAAWAANRFAHEIGIA